MADITSKKNPFYKSLLESINKGVKKTAVTGAVGSFPSSLIANLKRDTDGPFLIVTPLPEEAERVAEDISFFLPGSVHLFPSWETLPFDKISPFFPPLLRGFPSQGFSKLLHGLSGDW